jgi:hypothetical protein
MTKPTNTKSAITAILDGVEVLMAAPAKSDRASRLARAERETRSAAPTSPIMRAAKLANAERDVSQDAKRSRSVRMLSEVLDRYNRRRA